MKRRVLNANSQLVQVRVPTTDGEAVANVGDVTKVMVMGTPRYHPVKLQR